MKINDRNLASFASSRTPVDREGYLLKKGEVNRTFHKRWFLLKGNLLFYSDKRTDREPMGVIILEGCTVELAEEEEAFCFKVMFHGGGLPRHYVLCADTQDSMEAWMKALACASYDYLKLLVAELQRQLDEILEAERQAKEVGSLAALPSETQSTGRPQRFNPFDGYPSHEGAKPDPANPTSVKISGASDEPSPKYSFHELHEYYGFTFRQLFQKWKKEEQKDKDHQVEEEEGEQQKPNGHAEPTPP